MTSLKVSTAKFMWTSNELIMAYLDDNGSKKTMRVNKYSDLIQSINTGLISGTENTQNAWAFAMVLAAKSLSPSDHMYYSKLLKICLNIKLINGNHLSKIIKRMLFAGDDADGPDTVVKRMAIEASKIQTENIV